MACLFLRQQRRRGNGSGAESEEACGSSARVCRTVLETVVGEP